MLNRSENRDEVLSRVEKTLKVFFPDFQVECTCEGLVPTHPEFYQFHVNICIPEDGPDSFNRFSPRLQRTQHPSEAVRWIVGTVMVLWAELANSAPTVSH